MKKILLLALLLICSCDNRDTTAEQTPQAAQSLDKETVFSFDINNLQPGCNSSSEIVCTINTAVKCIINPEFSESRFIPKAHATATGSACATVTLSML